MADDFPLTVAGREIVFRPPTDAQLLIVGRLLRTSRKFSDADQKMDRDQVTSGVERMSMVLDIIDSMVKDEADRDFLEQEIIHGRLNLEELMGAFGGAAEDQPVAPVKKVAARKPTGRARRT